MEMDALVGSWNSESGDVNLEFKADGTYIRVSSFDMGITFSYANLSIDEEGAYSLGDGTVTFTPTSGHYRRNGVDEGFELKVVEQSVRLEPNTDQSGYNLVLADSVFTKK